MAGGAYKGLTIRIGADTSSLASALRGANSAIYKTEGELRKLNKAAKLDPANTDVLNRQIGALANQAMDAAAKLKTVDTSLKQMGRVEIKGGTLKEVADETENAALAAENAKDRYNGLTRELATMYTQLSNLSKRNFGEEATKFGFKEGTTSISEIIKELDRLTKKYDETEGKMGLSHEAAEKFLEDLERTKGVWNEASDALKDANMVESFKNAETEATVLRATVKGLSTNLAEMDTSSSLDKKLADTNERMSILSAASETATDRFKRLNEAYQLNPLSIGTAVERAKALAEATEVARAKAEELRQKIAAYKEEGIDKQASQIDNVAVNLEETKQKYADATSEVELLEGALDRARVAQQNLADSGKGQASEEYKKASASVEELEGKLEKAKAAQDTAFDPARLEGAKQKYADATAEVGRLEKELEKAKVSLDVITGNPDSGWGKGLSEEFKKASAAVDKLETELKEAKAAQSAIDDDVLDKMVQKYGDATAEVERLERELEEAKTVQGNLADTIDKEYEEATQSVENLEVQLKEARAAQEAAFDDFDTAKACNELEELQAEYRETIAEAKNLSKVDWSSVGTAAVQAAQQIGGLMQRAGSNIIEASNDIDSSYRDLRKTLEATDEQYQELYDAAMKYSQSHVTSADTMLEMEALAAQVGITGDALQGFAETAANLDVATDIEAEDIALKMGQIVNVMSDLDENNVDRFADSLVRLGNNMPAQESAIMNIAQRMSSVANITSMSTPDLLAWSAAIASTGARSESAATAIANTMTGIESAVASGGESLEAFAGIANMTSEEFADAWNNDPTVALKGFIEGLKNLEDSDESAIKALEDMGIQGVRQKSNLLALTSTVEKLNDALVMSNDAFNGVDDEWGNAGDAAREAERKSEGFSGALAKMKNSLQVLSAEFGEAMVPYMEKATVIIQKLIGFFDKLDSKTKETTVVVGGLFAAFSVGEPVFEALFGNLGRIFKGFSEGALNTFIKLKSGLGILGDGIKLFASESTGSFADALAAAAGKTTLLTSALGFLASPLGVVVGAVGLLAAALGGEYLVKTMKAKEETEKFNKAVSGIKDSTEGLGRELQIGSGAIDEYAEKWSAARVNMNEYHDELQGHLDRQAEIRSSMGLTVGELEKYQSIIGKAAGKGREYEGSLGELQWAIDNLNEITGESWTLQDVLSDKYLDESGAILNTRDAINELIEAKKKEAQIDAIESMLTENYKMRELNKMKRELASNSYQNWIDFKLEHQQYDTNLEARKYNKSEYIAYLQRTDEKTQELLLDSRNLREENRLLAEQEQELTESLGAYVNEIYDVEAGYYGLRGTVIATDKDLVDSLNTVGIYREGILSLAQGLDDAGVSAEDLANMGSENLQKMAEESGGSLAKLLTQITLFNDAEFFDKHVGWYFDEEGHLHDAEGQRVAWNEDTEKWDVVKLEAESNVEETVDEAKEYAESEEATMPIDGDASGVEEEAEEAKSKIESEPIQQQVVTNRVDDGATATENVNTSQTVNVSVQTDVTKLDELQQKLDALKAGVTTTVTVIADTTAAGDTVTALASIPSEIVTNITAKMVNIAGAAKKVTDLAESADKLKDVRTTYTASGNAATSATPANNISSLNKAANSMSSKYATYTASGNAATSDSPANRIWNLVNAINALPTYKSVTVSYKLDKSGSAPAGAGSSASGAYVPYDKIPRHAAGIFTRPTLTNIGWVGEDGAELYSGNSLIPLTNRKYSMPYINDISDAVAKKLGPIDSGPTINITVNGVSGPDETAEAIERKLRLLGF